MVNLELKYIEGLEKLEFLSKKVNLLKILRLEHNENVFSDIISELIKTKYEFIDSLLKTIKIKHDINTLDYSVYREYHRIDITIIFPKDKFIIGIENKIFADESENQLARYQNILQTYYPDYEGIFLFLTPNGRNTKTANVKSKFECYNISYVNVITALETIKEQDEVKDCVNQLIDAIQEGIIMDESTVKQIKKIWGNQDNRYYLEKLIANRPTILDIEGILTPKIEIFLKENDDAFADTPQLYKDCEIAYCSKNIKKKIPVWFVFYDCKDQLDKPFMRIIVFDFDMTNKKTMELNVKYNKIFSFEKVTGKPWLSLYSGKEPDYVLTKDHDYGENMAKMFFQAFVEGYKRVIADI